MTKTKYYDLQMDDPQDDYDVDVVNANLKKIDEQMKTRENATDALQEPEFTVAAKRENIASKEKMPKILGKIAKFFADLKTVAFSGKYNDLDGKPAIVNNNTTTEPGSALDARQANPNIEGTMAASIAQINSNLNTVFYAIKETKDANNADPGIARMPPNSNYDTSTNNPFPNFHTILLTIPFVELGSGYAVQIGVAIASQYNGKLAVRVKDSGNWQDWNVIS
jgi:hypothetical protein